MAKMTMSFDTVSKEFEVSIDGKKVENCVSLSVHPSWTKDDEFRCCVLTQVKDEASDMEVMTQICASEAQKDVWLDYKPSKHKGFVEANDNIKQSIASLFEVK